MEFKPGGVSCYPIFSSVLSRNMGFYIHVSDQNDPKGGKIAIVQTLSAGLSFLEQFRKLPRYEIAVSMMSNPKHELPRGSDGDVPLAVFGCDEEDEAKKVATGLIQRAIHGPSGRPAPGSGPDD